MSLTTTTGGGLGLVPQSMDQAMRLAEMMAVGKLVPSHLQRSPGDCLMVIEQAMRWGMSPFAVAQSTSVIQGKLMFEGKLVAAALHASGALATRLAYDYAGEGAARLVRVSAVLASETEPRAIEVKLADAKTTNGMWTSNPISSLPTTAPASGHAATPPRSCLAFTPQRKWRRRPRSTPAPPSKPAPRS